MIKQTIPYGPHKRYVDHFLICDIPEFAQACDKVPGYSNSADGITARRKGTGGGDWYGNMSYSQSLKCLREGDLSGVAKSDKLLSEIELLVPMSKAYITRNDVVGAVPNVPEFISGNPYCMRRRVRTASNTAPLSVFVDLPAQASISAATMAKRGAAMLALVRLLTNTRPVELWAACPIGGHKVRATALIRIDTSPLDLARAAHILTHASVSRALGFSVLDHTFLGGSWGGGFPLGDLEQHKQTAVETYRQVVSPGSDVLYIPPANKTDASLNEPVTWLKNMLTTCGNIPLAA